MASLEPIEYASVKPQRKAENLIVISLLAFVGFGGLFFVYVTLFMHGTGRVAASRRMATVAEISNLSQAVETFKNDVGQYPTSAEGLDALVTAPPGATGWSQYLREVPTDKWGRPYLYEFPNPKDPRTFQITSAGEDAVFGTTDDLNRATKP